MCDHAGKVLRIVFILSTFLMFGCSTLPERQHVPPELADKAKIPGIPDARFFADEDPETQQVKLRDMSEAQVVETFPGIYSVPHNYLAISGGGAHGAFGAGLLNGWSKSGTRPEFTIVTGVSTGALIAPFAFLGPEYDEKLKEVYTTTSTAQIARKRWLITAAFSHSLADTAPMAATIAKYITPEIVEAIAKEHQRGRRLYVATVNLDAGRGVIWDIGEIASSNHLEKVHLIHEVMRASASIPVAFPPIAFEVEAEGKKYIESHVDGGTGSQVFVYPAEIDWSEIIQWLNVPEKPNVYVIRNSYIDPKYEVTNFKILSIAGRTIASLIRTQGIGDLYEIYALCQRDGNEFHLAYIPETFQHDKTEEFDPVFMTKLFDLGFELAADGYEWKKGPPGFDTD